MTALRYIFGAIWCLFVWFATAIIVGIIISYFFPAAGGQTIIGIGLDWRNLPGTIIGFFAAVQSWRRHVKRPKSTGGE